MRKLDDMTKLVTEFKELAADLVNSNFMLYCYIPEGANGLVGWTFRDEKAVKERKPSKFWMGVGPEFSYGVGTGISTYYTCFGARIDMAWPISRFFSLGANVSASFDIDGIQPLINAGPLAKFTFSNNSALLTGLGFRYIMGDERGNVYVSLGWKLTSPWYFHAELYIDGNIEPCGFGVGVGYSIFGGR